MKITIDHALFAARIKEVFDKFHAGEIDDDAAQAEIARLNKQYKPVCFRPQQETDESYSYPSSLHTKAG